MKSHYFCPKISPFSMKFLHHCLILSFALLLLQACHPDAPANRGLYEAVPSNAVLVVESSKPVESLGKMHSTGIYQDLDSLPAFRDFRQKLARLQEEYRNDSLMYLFRKRPMLMVSSLSGADKYDLMWITSSSRQIEKDLVPGFGKNFKVDSRTYNQAEIFHFSGKEMEIYATSYQGLFIFSHSKNQVEAGVRQLNSGISLMSDAGFHKLYETANRKDVANIFVNLGELPGFIHNLMPSGDAEFVQRLGQWAELDMQLETNEMILSGLINLPEEEAFYLECFKDLNAGNIEAQNVVPSATGLWLALSFTNAEKYYRHYTAFLEKAGRLRKHEQLLEKLPYAATEHLLKWVDNEMGLIITAGKNRSNNHVAYLKCRSEKTATGALEDISDSLYIEGYRGMVFKRLLGENALPRLYGPLFSKFHKPYYTISGNYVLFSESLPVLKGVVNDILDNKTMAKEGAYDQLTGHLPDRAHIRLVAANPAFLPVMQNLLDPADAGELEKHAGTLRNLSRAALQIDVEDEAAFTHFYLEHAIQQEEKVQRIWSTQLQSEAANEPQFLKNHVNKKYDIAIQDKDHRLYLLDYNGKILWTKMLDGAIMGKIHQVDAYKNQKLQMVFNTATSLYLVDRLGRDVEDFPVSLPQAATAPVGVFNYDNSRNYRLVVPAGNDLLNYDATGKLVKGWNFKKAESALVTQPQHFSVKGKDVIVVETEEGKLLQLNRRGEIRFDIIDGLPPLHIPFYLKEADKLSTSEMLTIDNNGKLYAIHPGGTVDDLFLDEEYPADHFLYFDDRYIFTSDEMLFVKSDKKPWSAEMEEDISVRPKAMIFNNNFYAGAFSRDAEEIRLYNSAGELIDGFPVFAQGPFDMGSLRLDNSINIVTYSEDGTLICYRVE